MRDKKQRERERKRKKEGRKGGREGGREGRKAERKEGRKEGRRKLRGLPHLALTLDHRDNTGLLMFFHTMSYSVSFFRQLK
jgi:hypothetical protein